VLIARRVVGSMLLILAGATAVSQGQETSVSSHPSEPLKAYLRDYLSLGGKVPPDTTTRITTVKVKANNGKTEDVVYILGQRWCGSGGCTLLVLEPTESSFNVLGRVTIVQLPVRLLSSMQNGHPDIGVTVQGGGVLAGYEAVLSFNGKSYPRNPSLPPARKATAVQGKVIIANTQESVPLYE
jgi:hypothetical protein